MVLPLSNLKGNVEHLANEEDISFGGGVRAKRVVLYDSSGNEVVSATTLPSSIVSGKTTITTAGTPVRITAVSTAIKGVWLSADTGTGFVCYAGDSSVSAIDGSEQGVILIPSQPIFLAISNLNLVYLDSKSNGGKVGWLYVV